MSSQYHSENLYQLLKKQKIATMSELKKALGTRVDMTVFRKLKELAYLTSYSHRGSYYTLKEIARFNERGLWSHQSVWFSMYGTLRKTAQVLVEQSEAGYFVDELENILHVGVKEALLKLTREGRLNRESIAELYLYCATDEVAKKRQVLSRKAQVSKPQISQSVAIAETVPDELMAAIILFFTLLDEKQRRLYAGLESLKLGHGGDSKLAQLLNMDVDTVARGRRELLSRDIEPNRVRKPGAGRKAMEKKRPKSSQK